MFENATFGVEKGEFVCILGHSGCGKSTIMNILAGLAEPTSGVVMMDGREVSGPSLDRGVVFQNYSLLPWLEHVEERDLRCGRAASGLVEGQGAGAFAPSILQWSGWKAT